MSEHDHWHPRWARRDVLRFAAAGAAAARLLPGTLGAAAQDETPPKAAVEAYTGRLSYEPGEVVTLHVSCLGKQYSLEIARVGAARQVLHRIGGMAGIEHPTPANASTHGCSWPAALKVPLPRDCPSGFYSVTLQTEDAQGKTVQGVACFVVRAAAPGRDAKILLQLATNTYNAYNDWGGSSLYVSGPLPMQGARVSFQRPMARGFLTKPQGNLSAWSPYAGWHNWERAFVDWAEGAGYAIDYAVNSDLEQRPELLRKYRLVLSVGHDEYWSAPMRDALESYIAAGGNVAFFSGNVAYWQVRSENDGQALVCYKYGYQNDPVYPSDDKQLLASLWSHRLVGRPENQMTGVSFNRGGYHRFGSVPLGAGGYTIQRPEHWVFAGTELKWGDLLGSAEKIVGYECDGCEYTLENALPVPTHADGTPEGFQILATAPAALWETDLPFAAECLFGEATDANKDRVRRGAAVMGTYTRGGTVFTTGCTEWSRGLEANNPLVERITRNVLDRLSA
jgi:hypothetical protein